MNDTIIITDLTRFQKEGKVCIAGYSQRQKKIIRPLFSEQMTNAYLDQKVCEQYNILPGTRLSGDFESMNHQSPHHEDHLVRGTLNVDTPATKEEFLAVLQATSCETLNLGFGCSINDKVIPGRPGRNGCRLRLKSRPGSPIRTTRSVWSAARSPATLRSSTSTIKANCSPNGRRPFRRSCSTGWSSNRLPPAASMSPIAAPAKSAAI